MHHEPNAVSVGDLISLSPAPPVVCLTELERVRGELSAGGDAGADLADLLTRYCLDDPDTRAAFDVVISGLAREQALGDAFHLQGVYGAGKSHLLAAAALLCGHPEAAWPPFLSTHPRYAGLAQRFRRPRLVAAIALDEYPVRTHPLEHIVLSRIEQEFAKRRGARVALTEESHLLELVERYLVPQAGPQLDDVTVSASGLSWRQLRERDPERAAAAALEFIEASQFPLDWRRSRVEAWAELQRALQAAELDGLVVILDELGLFLAGKDRRGLNADASFLQWLAQRTATARCWLICATQRGFEEVGDIDRRTLRQLRDRFRAGFTLDLSSIEWVVQHKVAPRRDAERFTAAIEGICARYRDRAGEELVSPGELAAAYPLNPLCLKALRRAAETCLSRTRSVAKLLQQAAREKAWLQLPAGRLITPNVVFDVFRGELSMSVAGRKHLDAYEAVTANANRIARGCEAELAEVMKTLCLLGIGELRWTEQMVRASLVGCEDPALWEEPAKLRSLLQALYLRGGYAERVRREDGDEYFIDVSTSAAERIRQRLGELTAELGAGFVNPASAVRLRRTAPNCDSRVLRAALATCREPGFPIAALAEPGDLAIRWLDARRLVHASCADLRELNGAELANQVTALASPLSREDGCLFLASPLSDPSEQESAWSSAGEQMQGRFAAAAAAWIPAPLSDAAREHLIEHAALSMMVADKTLFRRAEDEFRQRVRERWAASEAEVGPMLQRAYYEGRVIAADGRDLIAPARLWALFGQWQVTLAEVFAVPFARLFPRFASVAPLQPLSGRLHTNQIIDQFVRPGEALLPPASTLEAHLSAFAAPLGLVEMEGRRARLALTNAELVQAALSNTPERTAGEIVPDEAIAVNDLVGRLAKSEWGLTREQGELLLAALLRTGHLVGLDAFLQPVRLDQIAAPLGDNLPFVMRGAALTGAVAGSAQALWQAASGRRGTGWSLPAQERAWAFFITWAKALVERSPQSAEAITRAAVELGHPVEDWDWAREALGRAEAVARAVDPSLSSHEGLTALALAVDRLPGGIQQTCKLMADWYSCNRFLEGAVPAVVSLRRLVAGIGLTPEDGLLAREQRAVLADLDSSERVVRATDEVAQSARRWLESYRRHYLAWHARAHAAARFEPLIGLRRSPLLRVVTRLGQVGLRAEEAASIEAALTTALNKRCLAGDPLPDGHTVCPLCQLGFKQDLDLPDGAELHSRAGQLLVAQLAELASHSDMLRRRIAALGDARAKNAVAALLDSPDDAEPDDLLRLLTDDIIAWLRQQLGQPRARRRELAALAEALQGKELTAREVVRVVREWLGADEDDVIEIQ